MPQDSLNSITTVIAQQFDREQDEPFKRSMEVRVNAWRSKLIANSLEKKPQQRKFFAQTLWVPMECHSRIPCPTPITICNVMRSKQPIPQPMRYGVDLFDYVGAIDGETPFNYAAPGTTSLNAYAKYAQFQEQYEYENSHIIVTRKKDINVQVNIPMIRVDAVFDDVAAIFAYNCNSGQCDYWDLPYPVPGDIRQMIIQYILQVDFAKDRTTTPQVDEVEVDPGKPKNR